MIPQANITAWRSVAPWPDDAQVEQDLALSRATCELFSEKKLFGKIALRGGTSLQKLLIHPAHRYSEDIDLVQLDAEPIGDVIDVIRSVLDSWLGEPRRKRGPGTVTLIYRFDSEIQPIRPLRLKIEINTPEHFSLVGMHGVKFVVDNPWFNSECIVQTFEPDELLATKLRALYQRRKSRDLFDLWLSPHWVEHKNAIAWHRDDWLRLRKTFPNHELIVGGDYNQNRDGFGKYGTTEVRNLLSAALTDAGLSCVTEADFVASHGLSRRNIDHVCLSKKLAARVIEVQPWEGIVDDVRLSDHNGITVDLADEN